MYPRSDMNTACKFLLWGIKWGKKRVKTYENRSEGKLITQEKEIKL